MTELTDQYNVRGIFQGDIVIAESIQLALDDMRKNPWIIEDCFSSLIENPLLRKKYGLKEVQRAKEFILNDKIPVFMKYRLDKEEFPCITISIGPSDEDDSLATLGDSSIMVEDYDPDEIGKTIRYIIPPFQVVSYDKTTGIVEVPEDIDDYKYISKGMAAVDPNTGAGFIIQGKAGDNGFHITPDSDLSAGKIGIVPQYQLYRARRERIISQEQYHIGCNVSGDPSTLMFLFSVVKYGLLRYREALLEHENFQLSSISCTDMIKNTSFDTENVFSRFITLKGQVEESWVKTPERFIESTDLSEVIDEDDTPSGTNGQTSTSNVTGEEEYLDKGIKILSQDAPEDLSGKDELWITVDED